MVEDRLVRGWIREHEAGGRDAICWKRMSTPYYECEAKPRKTLTIEQERAERITAEGIATDKRLVDRDLLTQLEERVEALELRFAPGLPVIESVGPCLSIKKVDQSSGRTRTWAFCGDKVREIR